MEELKYEDIFGKAVIERGILDPSHTYGILKIDAETLKNLETLEKQEVVVGRRNQIEVELTKFSTVLEIKYGYGFDAETISQVIFHLLKAFNISTVSIMAYFWKTPSPVVFALGEGIALIVAPELEEG